MRIVWLEDARDDLSAIRRYIGRDNPAAARRVATRITAAVARLADAPHSGRPGRWAGTREIVITGTPYLAPYRVREGVIEVLRVFHGAQERPEQPGDDA
jgi:toxin ParE1/3/4